MTRLPMRGRRVRLILPMLLWLASGCAAQVSHFPPAADLDAAVEAKPVPTAAIVEDAAANALREQHHRLDSFLARANF